MYTVEEYNRLSRWGSWFDLPSLWVLTGLILACWYLPEIWDWWQRFRHGEDIRFDEEHRQRLEGRLLDPYFRDEP